MDTDRKQEQYAILQAVQNGSMSAADASKKLEALQSQKRTRGRPPGITTRRAENQIVLACAFIVFRPTVKNNDEAYLLVAQSFASSESEVKKAVLTVKQYDPFPQVWFRTTAHSGIEMLLADLRTANRVRWFWLAGVPIASIPVKLRRMEQVSQKRIARGFSTAIKNGQE